MKISAIVIGCIGALAIMSLDSSNVLPIIVACGCLVYEVFFVCVNWDNWMRKWNAEGYWDYEPEDLGEIEDLWGRADIVEWDKRWNKK